MLFDKHKQKNSERNRLANFRKYLLLYLNKATLSELNSLLNVIDNRRKSLIIDKLELLKFKPMTFHSIQENLLFLGYDDIFNCADFSKIIAAKFLVPHIPANQHLPLIKIIFKFESSLSATNFSIDTIITITDMHFLEN